MVVHGNDFHSAILSQAAFTQDAMQREAKVGNLREWSLSSLI